MASRSLPLRSKPHTLFSGAARHQANGDAPVLRSLSLSRARAPHGDRGALRLTEAGLSTIPPRVLHTQLLLFAGSCLTQLSSPTGFLQPPSPFNNGLLDLGISGLYLAAAIPLPPRPGRALPCAPRARSVLPLEQQPLGANACLIQAFQLFSNPSSPHHTNTHTLAHTHLLFCHKHAPKLGRGPPTPHGRLPCSPFRHIFPTHHPLAPGMLKPQTSTVGGLTDPPTPPP